jgi:hypothetical protein
MADIRVAQPIRIVDIDTNNEADVTAAGNLGVEVRIALPAGTNNIGDIDVLTMPGTAVEDAASSGGETGIAVIAVRNDAAASKTNADGDFSMLAVDAAGRVGIADLGGSVTIDGSVSITGSVDTELPAAAALADATANPTVPGVGAFNMGYNGATWDRVRTANTGRLQVDVITGGGSDSPTNPAWDITNLTTPVNLAAGAGGNADSADLPSKYLWQVTISSSVAFKAILGTNDNGSIVNKIVLFGRAGTPLIYEPKHRSFIQAPAAGVGVQGWRVALTSLDISETADFYVSYAYADN